MSLTVHDLARIMVWAHGQDPGAYRVADQAVQRAQVTQRVTETDALVRLEARVVWDESELGLHLVDEVKP